MIALKIFSRRKTKIIDLKFKVLKNREQLIPLPHQRQQQHQQQQSAFEEIFYAAKHKQKTSNI